MKKNKCGLKAIWKNCNTLQLTAAILRYTSLRGGFDAFLNEFATNVAEKAVRSYFNKIEEKFKTKKAI